MSPPFQDNQGNQQKNDSEETKLSVEEKGGTCQNPDVHQEEQEKCCKVLMCQLVRQGNSQQLDFDIFFLYGTRQEIETQIKKIRSEKTFEKLVPFLEVSPDGDNYTFQVPLCGQGYIKLNVNVNSKISCVCFDHNKVLVSIPDIKEKSRRCIDGTTAHEMRLHDPDLPACVTFSLLCKTTSQMRTPTNFKVVLKTTDQNGTEIIIGNHTVEKDFPACFYATNDEMSQKNPKAGNSSISTSGKKILEDNHDKICKIQNWAPVKKWLVTNGVLDKKFLNESSLSEESKGEILRHLYKAENIFPKFIEALETTGGNEELVKLLLQCMASMENQNSSL
ncbi:uncharacterized protein LOC116296231 [Actinia tenebrosa]|uniref:Uncharacterized protein LOC116296231 n=1 Tax=Actinia tenebrosa TaxID=6105 RepID=A0A6P8HUI8_ACTTE|nr:uncharacterized protein LOC116296231 [Actinia tenebrosa]